MCYSLCRPLPSSSHAHSYCPSDGADTPPGSPQVPQSHPIALVLFLLSGYDHNIVMLMVVPAFTTQHALFGSAVPSTEPGT